MSQIEVEKTLIWAYSAVICFALLMVVLVSYAEAW